MKAVWNNAVIADSDDIVVFEGNHYFPPEAVRSEFLRESNRTAVCPWKGEATYYDVVVDGVSAEHAAWSYTEPKPKADRIRHYVAFLKDVQVVL